MTDYKIIFIVLILLIGTSCKTARESSAPALQVDGRPPVIIYKTKDIPPENVAVQMDKNKNRIISYPAPSDIRHQIDRVVPDSLANGYYLDNRGIGPNVAFLRLTYEKYSSMPRTPAPDELFLYMMEDDPLEEMYKCPLDRNADHLIDTLNSWIMTGKLEKCERIH